MPRPLRPGRYRIPAGAEFGAKRAGGARTHQGTDYHSLDNRDGEPIYGTGTGGVVSHIGYNGNVWLGLGHNVTIKYPGGRVTTDGHMRDRTPLQLGSAVTPTTVVGHVGHTGSAINADPPGSHDHHQMTINGVLVDPEQYYRNEPAGGDVTPIEPDKKRINPMSTLYYLQNSTPLLYALAGDSPGTPANWHETRDNGLATGWSAQLGGASSIILSQGTWDQYKIDYLAPLQIAFTGAGSPADNSEVLTAVAGVNAKVTGVATQIGSLPVPPTAAENGAAARAAIIKD